MFGEKVPSSEFINRSEYRDKVLGCWTGKNIGGTLGAPMEGRREIFDVKFYVPTTTSIFSSSGCSRSKRTASIR